MTTLRADLHVHSRASRQSGNMRFLKSRDCYSSPEDVYRRAKARGMDLVTLTDHDTIDGCLEFLSAHPDAPDFIMGEEVSCRFPGTDLEVHLGVYGITEALHRAVQPLRRNVFDVAACLREAGVFFALNHLLFFYRGQVPLDAYLALLDEVPAVEARNGTMLPAHNDLVAEIAGRAGRSLAVGVRSRCSAAATRIRCAGSARPGPRHPDRRARPFSRVCAKAGPDPAAITAAPPRSRAMRTPSSDRTSQASQGSALAITRPGIALSASPSRWSRLPAQFLPLAIVWRSKRREARIVRTASVGCRRVARAAGPGSASCWRRRMSRRRVAITGIGIVSALGATREATWSALLDGGCGMRPVTVFDTEGYRSRVAAESLGQPKSTRACRRSRGGDGRGAIDSAWWPQPKRWTIPACWTAR